MKRFEVVLERGLLQAAAACLLAWPDDDPDSRIERKRWARNMERCANSKKGSGDTVTFTPSADDAENIWRFSLRYLERTGDLRALRTNSGPPVDDLHAFFHFAAALLQKTHSPRGRRRAYEIDPLEAIDARLQARTTQEAVDELRKRKGIDDPEEKTLTVRAVQKAIAKGQSMAALISKVEGRSLPKRKKLPE